MIRYLLDTCVVSEISKPLPHPGVDGWLAAHDRESALSVLVVGEARFGIEVLSQGARRDGLRAWLQRLEGNFAQRILPVDQAVADYWATMRAARRGLGRTIPTVDGLIVATAWVHGLTVVTRHRADMHDCGVPIFDPWQAP